MSLRIPLKVTENILALMGSQDLAANEMTLLAKRTRTDEVVSRFFPRAASHLLWLVSDCDVY